jgi:hypothetical protein
MRLETLFQTLHCCLQELEVILAPQTVAARLEQEADEVRHDLRQAYDQLPRRRRDLEALTASVARDEKRIPALTLRVETLVFVGNKKSAFGQALELDQLRRSLEVDRGKLRQRERDYAKQVRAIERLQYRRDQIAEQLRRLAHSPQTSPSTSSAT